MPPIQQPPVNDGSGSASPPPVPAELPSGPVTEAFVRQFLGDVQGNILKGHGRPYVKCLFFTFVNGDAKAAAGPVVRDWIRRLADGVVTSAPRQLEETELYHNHGIPGGLFGAFFLSSAGYRYLDAGLPVPPPFPGAADADAFAAGMKDRQDLLNDPAKGKMPRTLTARASAWTPSWGRADARNSHTRTNGARTNRTRAHSSLTPS